MDQKGIAPLIIVAIVVICLSALVFYVWRGGETGQTGENTQTGENSENLENVDLAYLASHMQEFENRRVWVTGRISIPEIVAEPPRTFWLDGVLIILPDYEPYPPNNSILAVIGTVVKVGENFYVIFAESWTEALSVFAVENNIRLTMSIEKTEYQIGEIINIAFEVKNDGSENLTLMHPAAYGVFVFDVYDENNVWLGLWPGGAGCVFTETNIGPGEAHSENLEWDQKVYETRGGLIPIQPSSLGTSLKPGKYYISHGWIGSIRTPLLEITLENTE